MPLDNIDFNLLQRILDRINSVHNQVCAFNYKMMELSKNLINLRLLKKLMRKNIVRKWMKSSRKNLWADQLVRLLKNNSNILTLSSLVKIRTPFKRHWTIIK